MKHFKLMPLIAAVLIASACVSAPDATPPATLDWVGTYEGVLPAAAGEGIKTTLTLNEDGTWKLVREYLGESDAVFVTEGAIQWRMGGTVALLADAADGDAWFQLGTDRVIQLDRSGKPVTGALADAYVLPRKVDATSASTSEGW